MESFEQRREKVIKYLKKIGVDEKHPVFHTTLQYYIDLGEARSAEVYSYVSSFVQFEGKVVLEVGSGSGNFLRYLQKKGIEAYGIEIVPELASLGKNVVVGDALKPPFREKSFDIIVAIDVIEHIQHQFTLIKRYYHYYAKGVIAFSFQITICYLMILVLSFSLSIGYHGL